MILERLQYFLEHFGSTKKSTKSGTSDDVFITKILKTILVLGLGDRFKNREIMKMKVSGLSNNEMGILL